jgi:hypothetical protein
MFKPGQTPLNKAPSKGEKERTKREGPEYEPKEQNSKGGKDLSMSQKSKTPKESKGGKDLSMSQKSKLQSRSQRGKGTNHVS